VGWHFPLHSRRRKVEMNAGMMAPKKVLPELDAKNYTGIAFGYGPDNRYLAAAILAAYAMAEAAHATDFTQFVADLPIWVLNPDQPNDPPADYYPVGVGTGVYHEYIAVNDPAAMVAGHFNLNLEGEGPALTVLRKLKLAVEAGKRATPAGFDGNDNVWPLLGFLPGNLPMMSAAEWVEIVREALRVFAYATLPADLSREERRSVLRMAEPEGEAGGILSATATLWLIDDSIQNPLTWDGYGYLQTLYGVAPEQVVEHVRFWTELAERSREGFAWQKHEAETGFKKAASGPLDLGFGQSLIVVQSPDTNNQFGAEARRRNIPLFMAVLEGGRRLVIQAARECGVNLDGLPACLVTQGFPEHEIWIDQWSGSVIIGGTRRQPLEMRTTQGAYNVDAVTRAIAELVGIEYRSRQETGRAEAGPVGSPRPANGRERNDTDRDDRNLRRRRQSRPGSYNGGRRY
jgi:hypothetical protein